MSTQAPSARRAARRGRVGRPPKRPDEIPTRERLLAASVDVVADRGFSQASVTDIAERAGISGPAVYKHFDSKADLLIHAARHSLDHTVADATDSDGTSGWDPRTTARRWLADDFAPTRRLLLELHLAAGRESELADLLTQWHLERTRAWQADRADPTDRITAFYLLLLGLAQIDALASLDPDPARLRDHVDRMVDAIFDEPSNERS